MTPRHLFTSGRIAALQALLVAAPLFAFTHLPVLTLMLFSFHAGQVPVPPFDGPTVVWYPRVLANERVTGALANSVWVGVLSSALATLLAMLAAWGLARHRVPARRLIEGLLLLPLAVSYLVIGIGLLVALSALDLSQSLWAVGVGHVVLNLPLAFVVVYAQFDPSQVRLDNAARDLGASEPQVFLRVTLPLLRPAIVAAFLLSLTVSWDEFIVSFLLSGFDPTLPVVIWGLLRSGLNPQTNVIGTLVFAVSLLAALLVELAVLKPSGGRDTRRR